MQYTYRGAYLNALNEVIVAGLGADSVYLWTLPMFHCNGWCFPWAVTAVAARHVTMRAVDPGLVWELIDGEGVTHYNGAPTVQLMVINHPRAHRLERPVTAMVAAAPPSPTLLARMSELNFRIVHVYGLTETYGPITVCPEQEGWRELPVEQRAKYLARQGQAYPSSDLVRVVDAEMNDVPQDGQTMGEVIMRGNNVMSGYFDDQAATAKAFAGGWFHSGDLAVWHPDGNIELRDRGKDIIISGGENISSIEVEQAITAHPAVLECAVVGIPHPHWGERPEGVRHAQRGRRGDPGGDHRVLPRAPRPLQVPRRGRVRAAAQDLHRQDPEVRAARPRMGGPGRADRRRVTRGWAMLSERQQLARMRQLAGRALGAYPLADPQLRLIAHQENTTFRVDATAAGGRDRFLLRVHRPARHGRQVDPVAAIRSELDWLMALRADTGLPVPEPVRTTDGSLTTTAVSRDVPEPRVCSVLRWMDGRIHAATPRPVHLRRLGSVMARLHNHAAQWDVPPGFVRIRWDAETFFGDTMVYGGINAAAVWDLLPAALRRRFDQVAARMERVMTRLGDDGGQVRPHPRRPAPRQCAVLARRGQGHRLRRLRIRLLALRHRRRAVGTARPGRLRPVPGRAHRGLHPAPAAAARRPGPSR